MLYCSALPFEIGLIVVASVLLVETSTMIITIGITFAAMSVMYCIAMLLFEQSFANWWLLLLHVMYLVCISTMCVYWVKPLVIVCLVSSVLGLFTLVTCQVLEQL